MAQANEGSKAQVNSSASVKYGVYNRSGEFAGKTVAQVRQELGPQWSIPGDATAFKGKQQMGEDYVIQPGDALEFHRRLGEKGRANSA